MHILDLRDKGRITSARENAHSLVWNNRIVPLLQKLESVAAGIVSKDTVEICKNE